MKESRPGAFERGGPPLPRKSRKGVIDECCVVTSLVRLWLGDWEMVSHKWLSASSDALDQSSASLLS